MGATTTKGRQEMREDRLALIEAAQRRELVRKRVRELVAKYAREGLQNREISKLADVNETTVARIRKQLGIPVQADRKPLARGLP
jgi:catalase